MSVTMEIAADRRRKVLDALSQMQDGLLSEDVILRAVCETGRDTDRDTMRDDLSFLQHRHCVVIEKLPRAGGEMWRVRLTDDGLLAAQGKLLVNGVARRTVG
ncbi:MULTISPECIES: hypothetical protein [Acetobacter]|uniref:hypothetical protein n=1 Tax=Acetobacter TaxID=434 RepID=UPI000508D021|nr:MULTISPECIES: hypothetical protein [Acetobacter]KAA8386037.1 hypothetical protein FKW31_07675 [Acetobacter sp. DmW_136]KAA8420361.1 hypothetical protein FKW54_14085 [Acetobacter pomorum]KAA8431410.1 hypothetical protein FKW50_13295 [Acetobacter pomorum]KAA8452506.1 hypothetical protein FKW52_07120 [Acetobacter pomorum]KGB22908.1 hypothetical protein ApDm4_2222 [Acetobacter pomorum]